MSNELTSKTCSSLLDQYFTLLNQTKAGTACDHIASNSEFQDRHSSQILYKETFKTEYHHCIPDAISNA